MADVALPIIIAICVAAGAVLLVNSYFAWKQEKSR
jgi:hypothetical protein